MPYPIPSPYELLEASPDDDARAIRLRWGKRVSERKDLVPLLVQARNDLMNPVRRLELDILLVVSAPTSGEAPAIATGMDYPPALPDLQEPSPAEWMVTGLPIAIQIEPRLIEPAISPIKRLKQYEAKLASLPPIVFDKGTGQHG